MKEKCNKYESLFIFGSQKDLEEHLKTCPDCQNEYNETEKVISLVREVKPFIRKERRDNTLLLKIAASFLALFIGFFAINHYSGKTFLDKNQESIALLVKNNSSITQMGLPTDEYGLLKVK